MKIHFIDGSKKLISKEIAEIIKKRILEGCGKFQIFCDEQNNIALFINLDHVVFID